MKFDSEEFTGGESVYCINTVQLKKARELVYGGSPQGEKIRALSEELQQSLSRNDLAALTFVIIDSLSKSPVS